MNPDKWDFSCYTQALSAGREFPDNTVGVQEWLRALERLPGIFEYEPIFEQVEEFLRNARALPVRPLPQCPRVFISHRQDDKDKGLRIAELACTAGFNYWLDVLDPSLKALGVSGSGNPAQGALATALIIEMALLNCTHVLAVITDKTPGTMWVPYEYGRVKEPLPVSLRPSAWLDPTRAEKKVPEYMLLGALHDSEPQIRKWFADELMAWSKITGRITGTCPPKTFRYGPTKPLPGP